MLVREKWTFGVVRCVVENFSKIVFTFSLAHFLLPKLVCVFFFFCSYFPSTRRLSCGSLTTAANAKNCLLRRSTIFSRAASRASPPLISLLNDRSVVSLVRLIVSKTKRFRELHEKGKKCRRIQSCAAHNLPSLSFHLEKAAKLEDFGAARCSRKQLV